jgi:hypothetical protein
LQGWLPQTETHELANSDHLMPVRNSRDLAQALAGFFRRHPLPQAAALPQESITR